MTTSILKNGNVLLTTTDEDGVLHEQEFTTLGNYVKRVLPSGRLVDVCEYLRPTGPTLMTVKGKSLEKLILEQVRR
jgi:hypothetical protein